MLISSKLIPSNRHQADQSLSSRLIHSSPIIIELADSQQAGFPAAVTKHAAGRFQASQSTSGRLISSMSISSKSILNRLISSELTDSSTSMSISSKSTPRLPDKRRETVVAEATETPRR